LDSLHISGDVSYVIISSGSLVGQVSFSGTLRLLSEELVSSDPERNEQEGTGFQGHPSQA